MFIKVDIGDQNSEVYLIDKTEFIVGSNLLTHLYIPDPSVSKNHLKIIFEEDIWYFIDLGSTNGTFLNSEKVISGDRIKFLSDTPIVLAHQVTLTLLNEASEYKAMDLSKTVEPLENNSLNDKTQIISIDEFKKSKLKADEKRRKDILRWKAKEKKKQLEQSRKTFLVLNISIVLIISALLINKYWYSKKKRNKRDTIVKKIQGKFASDNELDLNLLGYRLSPAARIKRNTIIALLERGSCLDELVNNFCKEPSQYLGIYGIDKSAIFFQNLKEWNLKAELLVPSFKKNNKIFSQVIFLLNLSREFKTAPFQNIENLYLAYVNSDSPNQKSLAFVGVIKVRHLNELFNDFQEEKLVTSDEEVVKILNDLEKYFVIY